MDVPRNSPREIRCCRATSDKSCDGPPRVTRCRACKVLRDKIDLLVVDSVFDEAIVERLAALHPSSARGTSVTLNCVFTVSTMNLEAPFKAARPE